jgi:hypothetical protein
MSWNLDGADMQVTKLASSKHVLAIAIILTVVLGVLDYVTGYEASFFPFYFVPVALAAWKCGSGVRALVALLAAATWSLVNLCLGHHYSSNFFLAWNTAMLLISFFVIAHVISRFSFLLQAERAASEQLRKTLSEVKTLKGLLPICAHCKKVRNEKGYWEMVELYVQRHADAQFSHGICEECARKHYPEYCAPEALDRSFADRRAT